MALDQKLIGFWKLYNQLDTSYYEITPSGKLFLHQPVTSYEISADGQILTLETPSGTMVYRREGQASPQIQGQWMGSSELFPQEMLTFYDDRRYLHHRNKAYWGHYDSVGNTLSTNEFYGIVATVCSHLIKSYRNQITRHWYEFEGNYRYRVYGENRELSAVYNRHLAE